MYDDDNEMMLRESRLKVTEKMCEDKMGNKLKSLNLNYEMARKERRWLAPFEREQDGRYKKRQMTL